MADAIDSALETKISYKILKIILYAILLTPIWLWSAFLFPFITSKVIYFRLLIEIALAIYIPLTLLHPSLRPKRNWLTGVVWIYMLIMFVTAIFGVNFSKSLWGTIERGEGIITMLHFAAYFTMLPTVLRTRRDWQKYLTAVVIVVTFLGLIGLVQLSCGLEKEGFCRFAPPMQGTRISATIGNAAFYAAVMLFGAFLSWFMAAEISNKLAKRLFFVAGFFNAFIVIQTQTRGGAVALYFSVFLVILFLIFRGQKRSVKIASSVVAIFMVLGPFILFLKPASLPDPIENIVVVKRLSRIFKTDTTTQNRLETWEASWKGWRDRFILGYGYENYNVAFNKYFPPSIFKNQGSQIWFDRAHNTVLDIAVTTGVFGIAAYLGIFAMAFFALLKAWRRTVISPVQTVVLTALLFAYFIQNLFVFDTHATYLLFFLVLGFLAYLTIGYGDPVASTPKVYNLGYMPTVVVIVMAIMSIYFINLQPASANYFTTEGIKSAKLKQYRSVHGNFKKALSYGTYMDEEIRQRLFDYAAESSASGALSPQEKKDLYNFVVSEFEKNIAQAPHDVKNYLYLMNVFNISAAEIGNVDRVFELGEQALKLSPTRPQIYTELGQAAFLKGRQDLGLEYFKKAVDLNPQPKESHLNYILAAVLSKRADIVNEEFNNLRQLGHTLTAEDHGLIANIYGQVCDVSAARAQIQTAVSLESKYKVQGQNFIAELEKKCLTQNK
ncbi:MAG: hypothetical protein A3C85_03270 [Candidatus Doudnabacteria bacterium RIFCSPHIGHO2_02_FULL_48_21]|uniref:O-antigen ligase-related domain-containing protein n=1 Tax=Candidatus Doudnabacteria bacterium RIFCSPLOWO2_02_FULL_48_13 TaxID=1817845 RepID=A0A1F5QB19_9BACT|nr:MAG: hypothetical protein A3K05_03850 [Candidatus Doudnabacteria bacterium RIFCSPHIGHO2_01_48_18]OGE77208.1 MAG: hypothetical protein A2668_01770 [Candidatus Doudnabacteria bacterium RIFCSPHIGHO2_01_FULL_48_180]OGE91418.1 MAG: hypothetical protein A3F44_00670 [Candidatus Doudnabacteria bacterium RIFCSPHIGHO2_12_FULL_47_25]OGE93266.1 MAG: hypothetical protein A3C85_03270 [Candidatus Doudnabacteria bacterium RIFCSPHIGHO2_02_FULL_48_21]OGE96797.1 MAG: hypothetical protein A3A83_02005 [Candidatu